MARIMSQGLDMVRVIVFHQEGIIASFTYSDRTFATIW